jgi:ATP/maltotriose-dependent transcriptional regulator MalT
MTRLLPTRLYVPPPQPNLVARSHLVERLEQGLHTEEVLKRQPEDVQTFLLQTSILTQLNGALCNAVTGRHSAGGHV